VRAAAAGIALLTACSSGAPPRADPTPTSPKTLRPPTEYFNLTEDEAVDYLHDLDRRVAEDIANRDSSDVDDLFVDGSPAEARFLRLIRESRRQGYVDRTAYQVLETDVLEVESTRAEFEETRLVRPCRVSDDGRDVTPDHAVVRQVVTRVMALESLNWRLARDQVASSRPIGEDAPCP
jgi:hypothetical protein